MNRKYRLAYLISHPIQYQVPLLQRIAKDGRIDLTVYFCWRFGVERPKYDPEFGLPIKWDIPLLNGYCYKFLKNISPFPKTSPIGKINLGIISELLRQHYDAIWIHGYTSVTIWLALWAAWLSETPIILRGEGCLFSETTRGKRYFKRMLLSSLFKRVSCMLSIGKCNTDFYRHYGVAKQKIFLTPYAVDNDFFNQESQTLVNRRDELKMKIGITGELPVVLYLGKMTSRKRPGDLLRAFELVTKKIPAALVFVGSGNEKTSLEAYTRRYNLKNIYFVGFKNQSEISCYYTIADVFVLPSEYEPWGLAINEAMNFSLPVITTDKVAAAYDLVKQGENGFIYQARNIDELEHYLEKLLLDSELRRKMGKRALEIISKWSYREDMKGVIAALECIRKH